MKERSEEIFVDVVIHIFSSLLHTESGDAYRDLRFDTGLQSVLVSGESTHIEILRHK